MVGKDGTSQKTYSYTDYGETTEQGEFAKVAGARRVCNVEVLNQKTGKYEPINVNKLYTLGGKKFFHADYEKTLLDTYGADYEDTLVLEPAAK